MAVSVGKIINKLMHHFHKTFLLYSSSVWYKVIIERICSVAIFSHYIFSNLEVINKWVKKSLGLQEGTVIWCVTTSTILISSKITIIHLVYHLLVPKFWCPPASGWLWSAALHLEVYPRSRSRRVTSYPFRFLHRWRPTSHRGPPKKRPPVGASVSSRWKTPRPNLDMPDTRYADPRRQISTQSLFYETQTQTSNHLLRSDVPVSSVASPRGPTSIVRI